VIKRFTDRKKYSIKSPPLATLTLSGVTTKMRRVWKRGIACIRDIGKLGYWDSYFAFGMTR
jgi:hypothetical protein